MQILTGRDWSPGVAFGCRIDRFKCGSQRLHSGSIQSSRSPKVVLWTSIAMRDTDGFFTVFSVS